MNERILNDRYVLETKVGEGGMAQTYRARDLLLTRTVAVKVMREQLTSDPQFVERFRREAQAAARLAHENIAGVYDAGRAEGANYIVMEFVEGTDLKQRLRRDGALPVLTAVEIARQIAAALDAAHRAGLVHRDIKPHNILLNKDGKVKVTDFGIAKLTTDSEDTGVIMGSVHYLSPEQARGEATTPLSDLYSLGAVLYETLTGQTMFEGANAMAVAQKQIYAAPPHPSTIRPGIPRAVEAIVLKCLQKDPRARFQSAAELKAELTQVINRLAQEETQVIPTPTAPSMDATIVYRPPAGTGGPATAGAYQHPRQDPYLAPRQAPPPRRPESKGNMGWLIVTLFIILSGLAAYGVMSLLGGQQGGQTGPKRDQIEVPDLVNKMSKDANKRLVDSRLQPIEQVEASDLPKDTVIRQSPKAGTMVDPDTQVTYWVSPGPLQVEWVIPSLTGQSEDVARGSLKAKGFSGTIVVKKEPSASVPENMVVRTDPPAGRSLDQKRGTITLYLAQAQQASVDKEYSVSFTVPMIDPTQDTVWIRVDAENPSGSATTEQVPLHQEKQGAKVTTKVKVEGGKQATLVLWAGKDRDSLDKAEEKLVPAQVTGTPSKP